MHVGLKGAFDGTAVVTAKADLLGVEHRKVGSLPADLLVDGRRGLPELLAGSVS